MEFYKKVKKVSQTSAFIPAAILGIIGLIVMFCGRHGVIYQFVDAEKVEEVVFDDIETNTYVEGSLCLCLEEFATAYTTYENSSVETDESYYYLFVVFEDIDAEDSQIK